jgi:CRP-like cAMP-binding protein
MEDLLRQHIEKVTPLTEDEFAFIRAHFTTKKLRKHQFLVQEGDSVPNDFFVLRGCLKAYHADREGKEHILQFAMSDWWITDYQAYFKGAKATISVDCIENSELLCLSLQNREKLCATMHKMEHFFRVKLSAGYVALQQRILSMLNSSAKERYDQLLEMHPALFQKVPKMLIAAYLGVSRETLSRLNTPKQGNGPESVT